MIRLRMLTSEYVACGRAVAQGIAVCGRGWPVRFAPGALGGAGLNETNVINSSLSETSPSPFYRAVNRLLTSCEQFLQKKCCAMCVHFVSFRDYER